MMKFKLATYLKSLAGCEKGVAAIEMALVTPIIVFMLLASTDMASYLIAHQRISRAAYTVSNLMTQMDEGLTESQLSDMMLALDEVSGPFDLSANGLAVVTAIVGVGTDGAPPDSYEVAWQRCYGNSTITASSIFGNEGTIVPNSAVPDNTIVITSQIMVVTEVTYEFTPLLGFINFNDRIQYSSYFRPRLGSIESIVDDGSGALGC